MIKLKPSLLIVGVALLLSGCAQPEISEEAPAETESVEVVEPSEESTAPETPEYYGDFEIPADFPADIPIRGGELVLGTATGEPGGRTWAIEVLVDDLEVARVETLEQMKGAGFELIEESGIGTNTYLATLTRSDYTLQLKVYLEEETGEKEILYLVSTN